MSMPALEEQFRESACYGDVDAMSSLLKAGVNVNSVNKMNGWTALHWACKVNSNNIPAALIYSLLAGILDYKYHTVQKFLYYFAERQYPVQGFVDFMGS